MTAFVTAAFPNGVSAGDVTQKSCRAVDARGRGRDACAC